MKIAGMAWLLILFWGVTPLRADVSCYGGEGGPGPMFKDLSSSLVANTNTVYTEGGVRDFVFLENSEAVFYRNESNQLMSTRLGAKQSVMHTSMDVPLARLVDRNENYLLADGDSKVYDISNDRWIQFEGPTGPMEHLFWFTPKVPIITPLLPQQLLTLGFDYRSGENQTYRLYDTIPSKDTISCTITLGSEWRLARGMMKKPLLQVYPKIVFYREERGPSGERIIRFRTYNGACNPSGGPGPMVVDIPWEAPLVDAYWFPAMGNFGLQFSYQKGILVWKGQGSVKMGCNSFDLDGMNPIFVSDSRPILATWSAQRSLTLYDAQYMEKARLMSDVPLTDVDPRSLWLTEAGDRLFVSPQTSSGTRQIYSLSLKDARKRIQ